MNYRELQQILKRYKKEGLTDIALNSKKVVLQAELGRIESMLAVSESTNNDVDINDSEAVEQLFHEAKQTITELKAKYEVDTDDENINQSDDDWFPDPMASATTETEAYQPKYQGLIHSFLGLIIATLCFIYYLIHEIVLVIGKWLQPISMSATSSKIPLVSFDSIGKT